MFRCSSGENKHEVPSAGWQTVIGEKLRALGTGDIVLHLVKIGYCLAIIHVSVYNIVRLANQLHH